MRDEMPVGWQGSIQVNAASGLAGSDAASGLMASLAPNQTAGRGPVCIVDDDAWVCDSLSVLLETYGYTVLTYPSGAQFLDDDRHRAAKCLVIDQHMPGLDGLDVVRQLHRDGVVLPTILITGRLDARIAQQASELGIRAILEKPFPVARLVELIAEVVAPPDQDGR